MFHLEPTLYALNTINNLFFADLYHYKYDYKSGLTHIVRFLNFNNLQNKQNLNYV